VFSTTASRGPSGSTDANAELETSAAKVSATDAEIKNRATRPATLGLYLHHRL
jgi:hypothetical protein